MILMCFSQEAGAQQNKTEGAGAADAKKNKVGGKVNGILLSGDVQHLFLAWKAFII